MSGVGLASTSSFEQLHERFNTLSFRINRTPLENEKLTKLTALAVKIDPLAVRMWQAQCRSFEQSTSSY